MLAHRFSRSLRNVGVAVVVRKPDQVPLRAPATHLAFQVTAGLAKIGQSDGVRVEELPEGRDERTPSTTRRTGASFPASWEGE